MNNQTLERKRPATEPGASLNLLQGGIDKLKFTITGRTLHAINRAYPWLMLALASADVALLAAWLWAVTP